MGNELKFNSQVCTTKIQSQRLLELGLKLETADMVLIKELAYDEVAHCTYDADTYMIRPIDYLEGEEHRGHIPAWSLHRLIEMLPKIIHINPKQWYLSITPYYNDMVAYEHCGNMEANYLYKSFYDNVYDNIINCIEWLISNGYFNKKYLKQ